MCEKKGDGVVKHRPLLFCNGKTCRSHFYLKRGRINIGGMNIILPPGYEDYFQGW